MTLDWYLVAALTIPFVLLASNREWLFPLGGPGDSWINFTFYYEYGVHDPALYASYKATRLSWILKGMLAHRLLPPLAAHYVLHLTMFVAAIVLFYLIAKRLFGGFTAFLATAAFATYSNFHSIPDNEWDYSTHDGIVNLLLTMLLLLVAARQSRPRPALFAAGIAVASMVQDPYTVNAVPVLVLWYLSMRQGPDALGLWRRLGYVLAGGVAITVVYCLVSYSVGGPIFYYTQLRFMLTFSGSGRYQPGYWIPLGQALRSIGAVQVPVAIAVATVGMLAYVWPRRRTLEGAPNIIACGAALLLGMAEHTAEHLYGRPFLYQGQWVVVLTPWVFLAGAALLATVLGRRTGRSTGDIGLACVAYVVFLAPLVLWPHPGLGPEGIRALWNQAIGAAWPHLSFQEVKESQWFPQAIIAPFLVIAAPLGLLALVAWAVWRFAGGLVLAISLSVAKAESASLPLRRYGLTVAGGYLPERIEMADEDSRAIRAGDPGATLSERHLVVAIPRGPLAAFASAVRLFTGPLLVMVFLSLANVASASISPSLYAAGFSSCGYLHDQFKAVMNSYRAVRAFDPDYGLFLWYMNQEVISHPAASCRRRGITEISLTGLYSSLWMARYYSSIGPESVRRHWRQMGADGPRRLSAILAEEEFKDPLPGAQGILGGYPEHADIKGFSALPHARYWLFVTPNPLRVAVLSSDPQDGRRAVATLERLGTTVETLGTTHIHEGVISFDITFLRVAH